RHSALEPRGHHAKIPRGSHPTLAFPASRRCAPLADSLTPHAMKYLGLIRANLGRNKLRTALTGGAIMLAVTLVCLLLTMPAGLDTLLNSIASNTRICVHHKAGIVYSMPYAFTRKVRHGGGDAV